MVFTQFADEPRMILWKSPLFCARRLAGRTSGIPRGAGPDAT